MPSAPPCFPSPCAVTGPATGKFVPDLGTNTFGVQATPVRSQRSIANCPLFPSRLPLRALRVLRGLTPTSLLRRSNRLFAHAISERQADLPALQQVLDPNEIGR